MNPLPVEAKLMPTIEQCIWLCNEAATDQTISPGDWYYDSRGSNCTPILSTGIIEQNCHMFKIPTTDQLLAFAIAKAKERIIFDDEFSENNCDIVVRTSLDETVSTAMIISESVDVLFEEGAATPSAALLALIEEIMKEVK